MSNEEEKVTLLSSDGKDYSVSLMVAKMSNTLKDLIEDAGIEVPIPVPNVTARILEKVIAYCEYHIEHPDPVEVEAENKEAENKEKRSDDIIPWDRDFCNVDQSTLFEMILAANYLNIQSMLDVTCKTVANMIKGKTPEEIRKTFNIENDFTPEEEEAIRKENEWCEER
jgi:S-phase kinase-associated protein 1